MKDLIRVNMNLPINLVNEVKEVALDLNLNYTAAYSMLLSDAIRQRKAMKSIPEMIKELPKLIELAESQNKER